MWMSVAATVAQAAEPIPTAEELAALPDHAARIARLTAFLASGSADAEAVAAASVAQATVAQLAQHGRTDPSVVKMFLAAALSADPALRAAALSAASANGDPPLAGSAQPPPVAPAAPAPASLDPDRIRSYRTRYLHDEPLTVLGFGTYSVGGTTVPYATASAGWAVYSGGAPLRVPALAEALDDREMLDVLHRRNTTNTALGVVGWTAVAAGFGMMFAALDDDDFDLLYPGAVVVLLGTVPAMAPLYAQKKRTWAGRFWDKDDLDAKVAAHNQALQRELGLTPAEVVEAESGD
jgi:hypothetical protein